MVVDLDMSTGVRVTLTVAGRPLTFISGQVQACRPPFVPVPKRGPCKGWKETRRLLEADPHERLRVRQGRIDDAHSKAGVLAELEELHINETDPAVIARSIAPLLKKASLDADPKAAALVKVAQEGDAKQLVSALRKAARRFGLKSIDGGAREVAFNPRDHKPLPGQRAPRPGTKVGVVRPGYDFLWESADGRPVRLDKTIIED
jgi:hypothetical protein